VSAVTDPEFLDVADVLELHRLSLAEYGGGDGLRDPGLLESAVAQPQAAFGDQFAHDGLYAMAAAYLYHIANNHPFIDGNKRTGLLAALAFLDLNGITIDHSSEELYELTMGVAEGRIDKLGATREIERIATSNDTYLDR
jgi:death on curing protein